MTSAPFDTSATGDAPARPVPARQPPARGLDVAPVVQLAPDGYRACVDLPAQERACAVARTTVRQLLSAWEVRDDERTHDALVVLSELVGNAVRYGGTALGLDLALAGEVLTVAVSDASPGLPQQRAVDDQEEGGRGLTIVAALADAWGVEESGAGKRVWARLTVGGPER